MRFEKLGDCLARCAAEELQRALFGRDERERDRRAGIREVDGRQQGELVQRKRP